MYLQCAHGDGFVVRTASTRAFFRKGRLVSSDIVLSPDQRAALELRVAARPPPAGRLSTADIEAALRIPYDEDSDDDDYSLASEDTWSDITDADYEDEDEVEDSVTMEDLTRSMR
jgi:hypothetical protein